MLDQLRRGPGEADVMDWLARWPERRTLRELVNFLAVVQEIQTGGQGDPDRYVAELLDGSTKVGLEMAMTDAIAYLAATSGWGLDWAEGLMRAHEELASPFREVGP